MSAATSPLSLLLGSEFASLCDPREEVPDDEGLDLGLKHDPTVTPGAVLHPAPGVDLSERAS